ncbi:organellar and viral DNA polymerase type B, partial [Trichomonas vaginalis G3]
MRAAGQEKIALKIIKQNHSKKRNRSRNGQLWTWTCKLPINLERYQIFNELNAETAKKMMKDSCFIYACIQAGVDEATINHMREIIRVKDFPMSKIKVIAKETGIRFHVIKYNEKYSNHSYTYEPDEEPKMTVELLLMYDHYMLNEKLPISSMFIKNYEDVCKLCKDWTLEKKMLVNRRYETRYAINSKLVTPLAKVIELLFANNYFEPIRTGELCTYFTTMYNENLEEMIDLTYNERYCARMKKDWSSETKKDMKFPREHVFFADFEASTDGNIHKAYNICFMEDDDDGYTSIWGSDCASKFLEALPDKSLVYFHNLSYDVTFLMSQLEEITGTPIIKGSQTMQIQGKYKGKLLCFKDSYAIISTKLERFPEMFHLTSGEKEVFPYNYYTEELVNTTKVGNIDDAMNHVKDIEAFNENIEKIEDCKIDDEHFDME